MIKKLSNSKQDIWDKRMLLLLAEALAKRIADSDVDWCEKIGAYSSNASMVKAGKRGFTIKNMVAAARLHNTSLDWICGLTDIKIKNVSKTSGIELIEEGLRLLKK